MQTDYYKYKPIKTIFFRRQFQINASEFYKVSILLWQLASDKYTNIVTRCKMELMNHHYP
jgi:hypothetical protein